VKISYRRIAGDGAFLLACGVIANACLVLSGILVMRKLGPLGLSDPYFMLVGLMSLGIMAANLGVPAAAAKLMSQQRAEADKAPLGGLLRVTLWLTLAATALGLAGLFLYGAWGHAGTSIALAVCVMSGAGVKSAAGVLQGLGRLRWSAAYETALEILRLGALGLVIDRAGRPAEVMEAWAWIGAAYLLMGLAFAFLLLRREGLSISHASPVPLKDHLALALSLFFPFAGFYTLTQSLVVLLARAGQPGDAGRWAIAGQFASALLLIAAPLGSVLLPHYSRGAVGASPSAVRQAGRPVLLAVAAILAAASAVLCLAAGPVLALLYTPANVPPLWLVRGLCLLYAVEALKFALDPLLVTLGRWKALAMLEAARTGAALIAGYVLMPGRPLQGALTAMAVAVFLNAAGKAGLQRFGGR
jgi:O-antigen/teichoic acid export membrane protein